MREKIIYENIIGLCLSKGVGSLAGELSKLITVSLYSRNTSIIYNVLTEEFQSTKEISAKTGIRSNDVSAALIYLNKHTGLIKIKTKGKLKYWAKT